MSTLAFVLPLALGPEGKADDLERARRVLLPSLVKFLDPDVGVRVEVIVPESGLALARSALSPFYTRLGLRVVAEEEMLREVPGWKPPGAFSRLLRPLQRADLRWSGGRVFGCCGARPGWDALDGWRRQQVLKLLWARRAQTPFYVTLDADLCLTRSAGLDAFFPDGKALYTPVPVRAHGDWWRGAAATLELEARLADSDLALGVTPAILATEVVLSLLERLSKISRNSSGRSLIEYLAMRDDWTEYTLYWVLLLELGRRDDLHTTAGLVKLRHGPHSVWDRRSAPNAAAVRSKVDSAFADSSALFLVLQSSCVPIEEYLAAFGGRFR